MVTEKASISRDLDVYYLSIRCLSLEADGSLGAAAFSIIVSVTVEPVTMAVL